MVPSFETGTSYSNVSGDYGGTGNIDADPLFINDAQGNLRLGEGSPCIDAADGDAAPALDIEGNSRWDDPSATDTGTGTPSYTDMGAYEA